VDVPSTAHRADGTRVPRSRVVESKSPGRIGPDDEQVNQGGYGTSSEYVRELIRKDQDRLRLRGLLLAGARSAQTKPVDDAYFDSLRRKAKAAKRGAAR
jgi:antitoxin ParD1/3/4